MIAKCKHKNTCYKLHPHCLQHHFLLLVGCTPLRTHNTSKHTHTHAHNKHLTASMDTHTLHPHSTCVSSSCLLATSPCRSETLCCRDVLRACGWGGAPCYECACVCVCVCVSVYVSMCRVGQICICIIIGIIQYAYCRYYTVRLYAV